VTEAQRTAGAVPARQRDQLVSSDFTRVPGHAPGHSRNPLVRGPASRAPGTGDPERRIQSGTFRRIV